MAQIIFSNVVSHTRHEHFIQRTFHPAVSARSGSAGCAGVSDRLHLSATRCRLCATSPSPGNSASSAHHSLFWVAWSMFMTILLARTVSDSVCPLDALRKHSDRPFWRAPGRAQSGRSECFGSTWGLRNEPLLLALLGLYSPHQRARAAVVKTCFRASPPTPDRISPQAKPFATLPKKKSRRALLSSPIPHLAIGTRSAHSPQGRHHQLRTAP